jgi:hypothetical protein
MQTIKIFEIPADKLKAIKAILEAPDKKDPATGKWISNEWILRGYKLQDAKSLGLEGSNYFLYVKADNAFFQRNTPSLITAGAKELKNTELEKVKNKFESAEESAEAGFGSIFG